MTKSEKAWYVANIENLMRGLLTAELEKKWFDLHFGKTF